MQIDFLKCKNIPSSHVTSSVQEALILSCASIHRSLDHQSE
uniref:Uncharacterized protein n=1 Tax=Nelumbo nucifera TaxID=4432 RepID=A0A822Z120_NELNU|nr:TPA_asm: hypothetical protein HUJ06_009108 [Nelumbo nucifera]